MKQKIVVFLLIASSFFLFSHYEKGYAPDNAFVRYMATLAWTEEHKPYIDPVFARIFPGWTPGDPPPNSDCSVLNGHYYLDKAPGLSVLSSLLHPLIRLFIDPYRQGWIEVQILTFMLVTFPALTFLYLIMVKKQDDPVALLLFATGTPFMLYATTFFGILPAGITAYAGYSMVKKRGLYFLGGLVTGLSVLLEYPVVVLVAAISLIVLLNAGSWKQKALFFSGYLPTVILQLLYNAVIFGGPFIFSYGHKANPQFAAIINSGLFGFNLPSLYRIYGLLFSPGRGLFFLSPILLIVLFMLFRPVKHKIGQIINDFDVPVMFIFTLLVISGFVDWQAGAISGPRHLMSLLPFFAMPFADGVQRLKKWPLGRFSVLFLGILSVFQVWMINGTFFYLSYSVINPIYHQSIPLLLSNCTYPMVFTDNHKIIMDVWIVILLIVSLWTGQSLFSDKGCIKRTVIFLTAMLMVFVFIASLNTIGDSTPKGHDHIRFDLHDVMSLRACKSGQLTKIWVKLIP